MIPWDSIRTDDVFCRDLKPESVNSCVQYALKHSYMFPSMLCSEDMRCFKLADFGAAIAIPDEYEELDEVPVPFNMKHLP